MAGVIETLPDGTQVLIRIVRQRVGDLSEPVYQRSPADRALRLRRNLREASGYDPILAGTLLAFYRRNGKHAVADGLGTCWMAQTAHGDDYEMWLFLVSTKDEDELDIRTEQRYFHWLNQLRLRLSPADDFQSSLEVADPDAEAIRDLFLAHGITLARKSQLREGRWANLSAVNEVVAISVKPVLMEDGTKVSPALSHLALLAEGLRLQDAAWGLTLLDGQVLAGTARILAHPLNAGNCDREILADVMAQYRHPDVLKEKARDVRNGNGAGIRIARHLIRHYNRKIYGSGQKRLKFI